MIYTSPQAAQLLVALIICIGVGCFVWGSMHLRKPKVKHNKSIYVNHSLAPKKLTIMQRLKASWVIGWDAGRVYAEKKKQDNLNDK